MTDIVIAVRDVSDLLFRFAVLGLCCLCIWKRDDLPKPHRRAVDVLLFFAAIWGVASVALWLGARAGG